MVTVTVGVDVIVMEMLSDFLSSTNSSGYRGCDIMCIVVTYFYSDFRSV